MTDIAIKGDLLILSKWHAGGVRLVAERVRQRGYRPVLLTSETADRNAHVVDEVIVLDWDSTEVVEAVAAIQVAGVRPVGIVNLMDVLMGWQIELAHEFDVLGPEPGYAQLVDKARVRMLLSELGLTRIVYAVCPAGEVPDWVHFPAVVKPATQSGGSALVTVVHDTTELGAACAAIVEAYGYDAPTMVEEHVAGTEFSLDVAIVDSQVIPVLVMEKLDVAGEQTRDSGLLVSPPESATVVAAASTLADDLQQFAQHLDLSKGWLCVEARATEAEVEIIEINPRGGGGAYMQSTHLRSGVHPLDYQIDQHLPDGAPKLQLQEPLDPPRLGLVPIDTLETGIVRLEFDRDDLLRIPGVIDANVFETFLAVGPRRENIFAEALIGGVDLASLRSTERAVRAVASFTVGPEEAESAEPAVGALESGASTEPA